MVLKIRLKNSFDLDSTITCGQIFRFEKLNGGSYDVVLKDRVINASIKDDYLCVFSNDENDLEKVVIEYFDLNNNY